MRFMVFRTFMAKNSILAYISLKIGNLGKIGNYDVTYGMFVLFLVCMERGDAQLYHGTK